MHMCQQGQLPSRRTSMMALSQQHQCDALDEHVHDAVGEQVVERVDVVDDAHQQLAGPSAVSKNESDMTLNVLEQVLAAASAMRLAARGIHNAWRGGACTARPRPASVDHADHVVASSVGDRAGRWPPRPYPAHRPRG